MGDRHGRERGYLGIGIWFGVAFGLIYNNLADNVN